jgi:hypothetical protein
MKEEGGDHSILTSREGLETWIKYEKDESGRLPKSGDLPILFTQVICAHKGEIH